MFKHNITAASTHYMLCASVESKKKQRKIIYRSSSFVLAPVWFETLECKHIHGRTDNRRPFSSVLFLLLFLVCVILPEHTDWDFEKETSIPNSKDIDTKIRAFQSKKHIYISWRINRKWKHDFVLRKCISKKWKIVFVNVKKIKRRANWELFEENKLKLILKTLCELRVCVKIVKLSSAVLQYSYRITRSKKKNNFVPYKKQRNIELQKKREKKKET